MKAYEVFADAVDKRGITYAELARRVHMNKELLRRSLKGTREIKPEEFVVLSVELGLQVADFSAVSVN